MNAIFAIAGTTLGEAIRRRVLLVILLIGVLFVAVAPMLSVLSARQSYTVLTAFTLGIIQLTSAVIAIVLTVYLIPNEIERRTIYTILSKPVQRWQFLVGKYLGAVAALGIMMALMTVILLVTFAIAKGNAGGMEQLGVLAKAPMMFFIQMSLLAAVAVFFSTFVSPIVNFFLSGGTYLVGTLFSSVFESLGNNTKLPPVAGAAALVIHTLVPNFAQFNIQNVIINPQQQIRNEGLYYVQLAAYAVMWIGALLLGGILVFDRREV